MKRDFKSEINWTEVYSERFPDLILKPKKNQPCPSCGGTDRFHLGENWSKDGGHYCRHCGGGDGLSLIQKAESCSFSDSLKLCGVSIESLSKLNNKQGVSEFLSSLSHATNEHPYLKSRGIKMLETILQAGENIIIPKSNFQKTIGYESISPDGQKLHQGLSGGWYQVQQGNGFVFVEGYADGISVARHRHPDKTVIVCFGISNLQTIVKQFRHQYSDDTFILCVDAGYEKDYSKKFRDLQGCVIDAPANGDWNDFYDRQLNMLENQNKLKCTGYKIQKRNNPKNQKYDHSIVLTLVDQETGEEWRSFFSCRKTGHQRPDYPIEARSNLAKLYINCGFEPPKRWNRGQSIAKKLVGLEFYAQTEIRDKKNKKYPHATNLNPLKQITHPEDTVFKMRSNSVQHVFNLRSPKTLKRPTEEAHGDFRVPIPYTEETIPPVNKNITISTDITDHYQTLNNEGGFDFRKASTESLDQYFDRVIENTW